MANVAESARWLAFAVKADDPRRAMYGRWLARLRRSEIAARRTAMDRLPTTAVEIPAAAGHQSSAGPSLDGVSAVVDEVRRIRSTIFRADRGDAKPYLVEYPLKALDSSSPLLRFALSEQVVTPAARYLGMVPILTGVTVLASPYIASPGFVGSQLFHCDWEDLRQVKVFVHCSDVGEENGPLTAVSAEASAQVKRAVGYHYGGQRFRLLDEQVLPRVAEGDVTAFVGPAESATFIDTSSCLHLGSRMKPGAAERLVVQFQFLTPTAFDLQFARRGRARPFAEITGDFSPVQHLVLGATR